MNLVHLSVSIPKEKLRNENKIVKKNPNCDSKLELLWKIHQMVNKKPVKSSSATAAAAADDVEVVGNSESQMDHERQVGRSDASLGSRHTLIDNTQFTAILYIVGVRSETLRHLRNQHKF